MPDIIIHNTIGGLVYNWMQKDLDIEIDYNVFRFALLGPDPHIYYRFFAPHFHNGVNRRSFLMHNTKTGAFLLELARNANSDLKFSYLAGFLCHYSLDATCHPLVNKLAGYDDNLHRAIEHRLDLLELKKQALRIEDRPISKQFPPFLDQRLSSYVGNSMKAIYGWEDSWKLLRICYRHMKVFYWIIQDPYGLFDKIACKTRGKARWLSYRSRICDMMDLSGFEYLFQKAVSDAVSYINGAYRFYTGQISEKELTSIIGNRSYVTGKEE